MSPISSSCISPSSSQLGWTTRMAVELSASQLWLWRHRDSKSSVVDSLSFSSFRVCFEFFSYWAHHEYHYLYYCLAIIYHHSGGLTAVENPGATAWGLGKPVSSSDKFFRAIQPTIILWNDNCPNVLGTCRRQRWRSNDVTNVAYSLIPLCGSTHSPFSNSRSPSSIVTGPAKGYTWPVQVRLVQTPSTRRSHQQG